MSIINRFIKRWGIFIASLLTIIAMFLCGIATGVAIERRQECDTGELMPDGMPAVIQWGNVPENK